MADAAPAQAPETVVVERRSTGRSIAAAICLVLAALLTTPAAIAYWGQRTLNDMSLDRLSTPRASSRRTNPG